MKKLLLLFTLIAAVSCQYDDQWIKDEFTELEERIKDLESICNNLNSDIKALEDITKALKAKEYISEVIPISQGGKETGYKIIFESGREICIYHGKDGQNGADGYIPAISVKQDTDGEWYWTIDGEWMLDEEGNKVSTTGRTDLAPMLKIEDLYWYVSYDGGSSWTMLGKATGENGTSYFQGITQDEDNVYITLADGNTISLPKVSAFALELSVSDEIPCVPYGTIEIAYTLRGASDDTEVITIAEGGWNAEVSPISRSTGYIIITAPEKVSEGQVIVAASNQSKTVLKSLTFVEGRFISDDQFVLADEGGKFTVNLSTNYDYEIEISASWIRYVDTKAMREESVTFSYDPLPAGTSTRQARIYFKDRYCGTVKTIDISQGSLVSLNKNYMTMMLDEEEYLTATLIAGDQELIWTSSDSDIAWVSQEGKVIALSKGTATITVMTADYMHSAQCTVKVEDIADYVYLKQGSAYDVSYSGGYVHAGTKLSWYLYNNSSKSIFVKYLQIVDGYGTPSNEMWVEETLYAGSYTGWVITLNNSYYAPKCKAVYEYNGKEYYTICSHMFH